MSYVHRCSTHLLLYVQLCLYLDMLYYLYLVCITNSVTHMHIQTQMCYSADVKSPDFQTQIAQWSFFFLLQKTHMTIPLFTCTQIFRLCPYSEKDNILIKLFPWLLKMNITLIFMSACTRVHIQITAMLKQSVWMNFTPFLLLL